ncbi:MAG TPA: hypothetical protein GXX51_05950 [Firmicutes bacterium]|nr:hypothetical protein [Bacillota bacterium]
MSYERGLKALNLEMTEKIPHTEYLDHPGYVRLKTGFDLNPDDPDEFRLANAAIAKVMDYDLFWNIFERPITRGRITKMGRAYFHENQGPDYEVYCPFKTVEEVLNFDPVAEYGIPDVDITAKIFQQHYMENQALYDSMVYTGGRYHTLFSACIRTFGWEMFLAGAGADYERFDRVLEGFYEISLAEVKAWTKTGIKAYICHDDIVWSSGPVFHPDWYRKYIFPRYEKLWAPLKEAGIKVLYCSDGNFDAFVDDIVRAGADGFIFEPITSLERIAEKYGKSKVMVGNIDCRILTSGTKEEIRAEVKRCADIGRDCPGYFFAVGNHIPSNVPVENIEIYLEALDEFGRRS